MAAKEVIGERLASYDVDQDAACLDVAVDTVVRLVLSHGMQPCAGPRETSEGSPRIAGRVLR